MHMGYTVMYIIHISKCYMYIYDAIIMISCILYLALLQSARHLNMSTHAATPSDAWRGSRAYLQRPSSQRAVGAWSH